MASGLPSAAVVANDSSPVQADIERLYKSNRAVLVQMSAPERQFLFLRLIMPPATPVHPLYEQIPYMAEAFDQALHSDNSRGSDTTTTHSNNSVEQQPSRTLSQFYIALYNQVGASEARLRAKLKLPQHSSLQCFLTSLRDYLASDTLRARFFAQAIVIPALLRAAQHSNPYEPAVLGEFVDTLRAKSVFANGCTAAAADAQTPVDAPFRRLCLLEQIGSGTSGQVYRANAALSDGKEEIVAVKVVPYDPLKEQRSVWLDSQQVEAQFARIASINGIGPRFFGHWIVNGSSENDDYKTCFDANDILSSEDEELATAATPTSLLATELYRGGTLLDQKEIDPALVEQLRSKVAVLHALGLVHGDLQPKNVLVSADGKKLALTDWGLAFPSGALPRIPWPALLAYHREQPQTREFYNKQTTIGNLLASPTLIDDGLVQSLAQRAVVRPARGGSSGGVRGAESSRWKRLFKK